MHAEIWAKPKKQHMSGGQVAWFHYLAGGAEIATCFNVQLEITEE